MNTTSQMTQITYGNKLAQSLANARAANPEGNSPVYRIPGLRVTLAKDDSKNPGHLYVKDEYYSYLGKITPTGDIFVRGIDDYQLELLKEAIADPENTAMSIGRTTGTCCCCGRTLTNPISIELGIGPICRGYFFPDSEYQPQQQEITLEDLGEIAPVTEEPYDPAKALAKKASYPHMHTPLHTTTEEEKKRKDDIDTIVYEFRILPLKVQIEVVAKLVDIISYNASDL